MPRCDPVLPCAQPGRSNASAAPGWSFPAPLPAAKAHLRHLPAHLRVVHALRRKHLAVRRAVDAEAHAAAVLVQLQDVVGSRGPHQRRRCCRSGRRPARTQQRGTPSRAVRPSCRQRNTPTDGKSAALLPGAPRLPQPARRPFAALYLTGQQPKDRTFAPGAAWGFAAGR